MYLEHFGFNSYPFSIAPNPRFVYLSAQHREALAHLLYGLQVGGGFVALTGEVGTGKTTLCRCLLEQLPADVDIALIFNPRLSNRELLASICDELHIVNPGARASNKTLIDLLNHHLLEAHAKGRRTVLLIDEAQNLRHDVLEQIRLLTNLETNETKLLQIILVGQPELRDMLATSELRQLSQRITARYHLRALSLADTRAYIGHRLGVSGGKGSFFSASAVSRIHGLSKGVPRLINLICDRSLLGAYASGRIDVTPAIVNKAAREILAQPRRRFRVRPLIWRSALITISLVTLHGMGGTHWLTDQALNGQSRPKVTRVAPSAPKPAGGATQPAEAAWSIPLIPVETPPLLPHSGEMTNPLPPVEGRVRENSLDVATTLPLTAAPPAVTSIPRPESNAAETRNPLSLEEDRVREKSLDVQTTLPQASAPLALTPTPVPEGERLNPAPSSTAPAPGSETASGELVKRLTAAKADRNGMLGVLFGLWGVSDWQGGDDCSFARAKGLRCYPFEGDWQHLRELNHPALLEFTLSPQDVRHGVLVGVDAGRPVLVVDGQRLVAEPADFDIHWAGKALLLWKPPPGHVGTIEKGKRGPAIRWLRDRLDAKAKPGQEQAFDGYLASRIAAFQRAHGLRPDGSAGPLTLLLLNAESTDGPRLSPSKTSSQN